MGVYDNYECDNQLSIFDIIGVEEKMSIVTDFENICVLCNRPASETHHLVYGRGLRELCDEDKIVVPLCHSCHCAIHANGTAGKLSKIIGQLAWEKEKVIEGTDPKEVRAKFMARYGRSYV